jgi:uncharacterized phage-associated protein
MDSSAALADTASSRIWRLGMTNGGSSVGTSIAALTPASALDVARFFILLGAAEEEPELLSPMRLQKLLYYAQGWSLVERGAPMFSERIEAWAHGPVVPEVFRAFRDQGSRPIESSEGSSDNLTDEQRQFIERVWEAYKPFSAISLSDMTHEEAPWKQARGSLPRGAQCAREITLKSMKAFFAEQAKAR